MQYVVKTLFIHKHLWPSTLFRHCYAIILINIYLVYMYMLTNPAIPKLYNVIIVFVATIINSYTSNSELIQLSILRRDVSMAINMQKCYLPIDNIY